MPPPTLWLTGEFPSASPWVIVSPAMVTVSPALISKTRLASLPLIFSLLGPGPSMSRFWVDVQLAAGQRDGVDILAKLIVASGRLGVKDRLPQRAGAAVGTTGDDGRS